MVCFHVVSFQSLGDGGAQLVPHAGQLAQVTSHFFTQIAEHCGGFLGPSSAVDFCGQNCSFLRVYLKLGESLCLRCPKVQNFKIIWPAHEAGL